VIIGTFNRDIAIRQEDIVFFAPGNDPWIDSILKNSIESYRGRCCAIKRKVVGLNRTIEIFDLLYSISVDPRPLYRKGLDPSHLFRAQGYLQTPTYRMFLTKEGEVISSSHPLWGLAKELIHKPGDLHLGKRGNGQINKFQDRNRPAEWLNIIKIVSDAANKRLNDEFNFMLDLAEEAQEIFNYQASGQRAAKNFLYGKNSNLDYSKDVEDFEKASTALLDGIAHPIFELESVCFWEVCGYNSNE
jgi:hypothetical protein